MCRVQRGRFVGVLGLVSISVWLIALMAAAEGQPVSRRSALDFARTTYDTIQRDVAASALLQLPK
jgi:hypothetical protein